MIDWKIRISKDEDDVEYIDMQGMPYYHLEYDNRCNHEVIHDIIVQLPIEPPDKHCVNYGLSENDQIFRKTFIPPQVKYPTKDFGRDNWTKEQKDAFIDAEYNRRKNGFWIFIKNRKYYIPGQLWLKMNHWTAITGESFSYRDHERKFFTLALQVQRDALDLGIADFKCRQLGDTENALVIMYERGSRIRGGLTTLQSFTGEDHVKETYGRLVHGHNSMIYYMKPMSDGTEKAASGLVFRYPSKHMTHAEVKRQQSKNEVINKSSSDDYLYLPLNSRFKFGPSKAIKFDGATGILTVYGDEFGKASDTDPNEWLRTMNEAVYSNIKGRKRGFVIMTSTAEEINSDSLEWSKILYRESDPGKRLKTGSTVNRIIRIFRGVGCRGFENIVADRWGFIDEAKVIEAVTDKFNAMVEAGNTRGAISFLRKNPRTIEDVFRSANDQSQFHTENLTNREASLDLEKPKPWVRGNLKWADGEKDSYVVWEPNPNGRWVISKHPSDFGFESNKRGRHGTKAPGNKGLFNMGLDPIDQAKTLASDEEKSKMGFVVMRAFDPTVDSSDGLYYQYEDDIRGIKKGDPVDLGGAHSTNKIVCTYVGRDDDIFINFEDAIMTMVYYGTDFLPEKQKFGSMQTYMRTRGYLAYITDLVSRITNYKGQTESDGISATDKSFQDCFAYIETYTAKWCNAIDHPEVIRELQTMNYKNRGKKDLGVSLGWCLYQAHQRPYSSRRKEGDKKSRTVYWGVENEI